jgi:hypothetical protein
MTDMGTIKTAFVEWDDKAQWPDLAKRAREILEGGGNG